MSESAIVITAANYAVVMNPRRASSARSSPDCAGVLTAAERLALHESIDAGQWLRHLQRALQARDRRTQVALRPVDPHAAPAPCAARHLPVRDAHGEKLGALAIMHPDATARRALAALLRPLLPGLAQRLRLEHLLAQASFADLLVDLAHVLLYEDNLEVMLTGIVAYLRERFGLCLATLILREHEDDWTLRAAAGNSHLFELVPGTPWPADRGLTGKALRQQRTLYVPDVRVEPEYVPGNGLTLAELLIPIKHGGAVLGLLNLESPSADSFGAAVREVLDVLADQIGGVLRLRLVQEQLSEANRTAQSLARELARVNARLARSNRSLDRLSHTDALTGAENRRGFNRALRAAWQHARDTARPLGLLLIDIDHFKAYNDRYGHPAGDACLARVVDVLRHTLRGTDSLFARYGGEEFTVTLPGADAEVALRVADRLRLAVRDAHIEHAGSALGGITLSVGAASLVPQPRQSPRQLVELADRALYRAKRGGRDRACLLPADAPPDSGAQANGSRKTMVSSRSAPVATKARGHSASSSTARK